MCSGPRSKIIDNYIFLNRALLILAKAWFLSTFNACSRWPFCSVLNPSSVSTTQEALEFNFSCWEWYSTFFPCSKKTAVLCSVINDLVLRKHLASLAWLVAHLPAELKVVGSVIDQRYQQYWERKHCSHAMSCVRDIKQWLGCCIPEHIKELQIRQNYPQFHPTALLIAMVPLWHYTLISQLRKQKHCHSQTRGDSEARVVPWMRHHCPWLQCAARCFLVYKVILFFSRSTSKSQHCLIFKFWPKWVTFLFFVSCYVLKFAAVLYPSNVDIFCGKPWPDVSLGCVSWANTWTTKN